MDKKILLFCTGLSGSGKTYFINNVLPKGAFYNLKSATTRPMREGEQDGREYYFRDENYFEKEKFATRLFVNEQFWQPGMPKWLYGVPEFEILNNLGRNFTYDVIQPKYVRQMIDWFNAHKLNNEYDYRILFFSAPKTIDTVKSRANMPNDLEVRRTNTCDIKDFMDVKLFPQHLVTCNPNIVVMDKNLRKILKSIKQQTK